MYLSKLSHLEVVKLFIIKMDKQIKLTERERELLINLLGYEIKSFGEDHNPLLKIEYERINEVLK